MPAIDANDAKQLRDLLTPFKLIYWGAFFVGVDLHLYLRVNNRIGGFDVLPDTLGFLLLTIGIFILISVVTFPSGYELGMTLVGAVSLFSLIGSICLWFVPDIANLNLWVVVLLWSVAISAILIFCFALRQLCLQMQLEVLAASWKTGAILVLCLYCIPQLLGTILIRTFGVVSQSFVVTALLALLALVPLIFLLRTSYRMAALAQGARPVERMHGGTV